MKKPHLGGVTASRQWVVLGTSALAVSVVLVAVLTVSHRTSPLAGTSATSQSTSFALSGTNLQARPAPDFTLRDQTGNTVSLQSLRGHPVVLTFLDATCTE